MKKSENFHGKKAHLVQPTLPWVEKYRPTCIEDIMGNLDAISRLQRIAQQGNMPHLILVGPPGTGKTTSILCLAHLLLGQHLQNAVLEQNASDDRGIESVRTKIKLFAQTDIRLPPLKHKIVILDEVDSMTTGAQQALRLIMENHGATTRFALACNLIQKIIEPIQLNCAIIRFSKLLESDILSRIQKVCRKEKVVYSESGLEALIFVSDGDMRRALNNLQATYATFGIVSQKNVFKLCDPPNPYRVAGLLRACLKNDIDGACAGIDYISNRGYSSADVLNTLYKIIQNHGGLSDFIKLEIMREIGFAQIRITDGGHLRLQLKGLVAKVCKLQSSNLSKL